MGEDGFIIFWAKICLILWKNKGEHSIPPCQVVYIFDPVGNRVKFNADDKFMSFVWIKKTKKSLNKTECFESTKINYLYEWCFIMSNT